MAQDLTRTSSKRKRTVTDDTCTNTSPSKQLKAISSRTIDERVAKDAPNALDETCQTVLKLFSAIEATLLSSLSLCTFHTIQQAVENTARRKFTLSQLAQVIGVWPGVYQVDACMALVNNVRTPSLSIAFPETDVPSRLSASRRAQFQEKLQTWNGAAGELPALQTFDQVPLNQTKITSMQKKAEFKPPVERTDNISARKDGLLERMRLKTLQKKNAPSAEEMKQKTIQAMLPSVLRSLKMLLASRKQKSIGMRELCDNLSTSLHERMAKDDIGELILTMSSMPQYAEWCKVGIVGDVKVVRFVGLPPLQ